MQQNLLYCLRAEKQPDCYDKEYITDEETTVCRYLYYKQAGIEDENVV